MAVPESPLPASGGAELPDAEVLRWLYGRMVLIRRFEEREDSRDDIPGGPCQHEHER